MTRGNVVPIGFVFRAAFWIAVVAAFAPVSVFSSDGMEAPDEISDMIAQGQRLHEVCTDLPALCDMAGEAGGLISIATDETLSRVENWLDERESTAAETS
ncbi:hypothetical protein [Hyphobacterium sp.]|uniref:hypothetical protein n=1 Tax=Hyphobacterium sp. TaxID=2004662 RepID=UPI003B526B99